MGNPREFRDPALTGMRSWPIRGFGNHLVFYRPTDDGIEILRVLHGARDLRRVFNGDEAT
jgi:toxin ParE1/3/4